MDIKDRRILVLGGWGLVGMAILRKLVEHQPQEVIVLSLHEAEAREACALLHREAPEVTFTPEWGNIFVRSELKDMSRAELIHNSRYRQHLMEDTMEEFDRRRLEDSTLYQVISRHVPHIIIDAVNTATALAYQDIYNTYYRLKGALGRNGEDWGAARPELGDEVEKTIITLYIPQIIRHIQILHTSMVENQTGLYLKIGTTGTGGMGLNIPYTHSEERPSRVLLSKSALAGAHTMLLFLMGRTPGGPICKEVKPAAAVAWKGIQYGEIVRGDQPIRLYDCPPEKAVRLDGTFQFGGQGDWIDTGETLKSVYIDTGENGIFSRSEFETLTSTGQMEFVTPEEIANTAILEILGDSTGHDILNALDNAIVGPTYRAGYLRHHALEEMKRLEEEQGIDSVAFEILGPPRLSKLLYEGYLLKQVCGDLRQILARNPRQLSTAVEEYILNNPTVRARILSIGIPILLKDGKRLLRGPEIVIPAPLGRKAVPMSPERIEQWTYSGWVDLRQENMQLWRERAEKIVAYAEGLPADDSSSRFDHGRWYWEIDQPLNIGKVAAWIFINEDKGRRIK